MDKIVSARQAVDRIGDGENLLISGLISLLCPEKTVSALEERFLRTGSPRDLTVITPIRIGWKADEPSGMEHLAHPGLLKRHITGSLHPKEGKEIMRMIQENEIEGYMWPMGPLFEWIAAIAAGKPGAITDVGIGTYFDPRLGGGALNERTTQPLHKHLVVDGHDLLYLPSIPIHTAIITASTADEDGNLSYETDPVKLDNLYMAAAAKNSGGKVIAQVKKVVPRGTIPPHAVVVPGILVDAVVVDELQLQTRLPYDPSLTGERPKPLAQLQKHLPLDHRKVLLRRAALELRRRSVVNLGIGVGVDLPYVLMEEGCLQQVTFFLEHGVVGGIPGDAAIFGAHYNPTAILDSMFTFDYYHGGGLDFTVLGIAQLDRFGNVNVSKFSSRLRGPGGLIDITHRTRTLLFVGSMTAGGLMESVEDGRLRIDQEGRVSKFVKDVEQITFNGVQALQRGQRVLYIFDRCVFTLEEDGLLLVELAPGIDLETQVRPHIPFAFRVPERLREMDPRIFRHGPMGLILSGKAEGKEDNQ